MRIWLAAAAGGILAVGFLPALPAVILSVPLALAAVLPLYRPSSPSLCLLGGTAFGLLWGLAAAHWLLAGLLPKELERQDFQVEGYVAGLPSAGRGPETSVVARFEFRVLSAHTAEGGAPLPLRRLRLSWYGGPPEADLCQLQPGSRWQLRVRLRRPHGFANPGRGSPEAATLARGIGAVGYVRADPGNRCLPGMDWRSFHHRLRAALAERLYARAEAPLSAFIGALALGDRRFLDTESRQLLQHTGTAHLLAISGLHITFVALLCHRIAALLARLAPPLLRRRPAPWWGALCALLGAIAYAALAGFSLPTRRALTMVLVAVTALLAGRRPSFAAGFCLALLLVLMQDPLAGHTVGFWLSFLAVAALLWGIRGKPFMGVGGFLLRLLAAQAAVSLGLLLPQGLLLGEVPIVSPLANLFAIPLVSFLVVPAALAGTLLLLFPPPFAEACLAGAALLLGLLLKGLGTLPSVVWHPIAWSFPVLVLAALGVGLALVCRRVLFRILGLLCCLPLLWTPSSPSPLRITAFDVGQGLSVLVQTEKHRLLYDTGPRYYSGSDAGSRILLPALRRLGVQRLDILLVSHRDADHAGGAASILAEMPVETLITGESLTLSPAIAAGIRMHSCRAGDAWQWDGIHFRILYPEAAAKAADRGGNNRSCVLLVEGAGQRILLPGDVLASVESRLSSRVGGAVDILVAPHHGSRSSSSPAFVASLRPRHVIFASGYRNAFGHPHPEVQESYRRHGSRLWNTGEQGAVHFEVNADGQLQPPVSHREKHRRYWDKE